MKEAIELSFRFKGNRTYVQGPDIFDAICDVLKTKGYYNLTVLDISFHSIISHQVSGFIYTDEEDIDAKDAATVLYAKLNDKPFAITLTENTKTIEEKYAYPEEEIVNNCMVDKEDQSIMLEEPVKYSNLEKFVAMNKALLNNLFKDIQGKWYFTRLQIDKNFEKDLYGSYKVKLIKNLKFKLTKSEIYIDNKLIGYIYFTLK